VKVPSEVIQFGPAFATVQVSSKNGQAIPWAIPVYLGGGSCGESCARLVAVAKDTQEIRVPLTTMSQCQKNCPGSAVWADFDLDHITDPDEIFGTGLQVLSFDRSPVPGTQ